MYDYSLGVCHGGADAKASKSAASGTLPKVQKKADVGEHPEMFPHVGLLFSEPPGTAGLSFA